MTVIYIHSALLTAHMPQLLPMALLVVVVAIFVATYVTNRVVIKRVRHRSERIGFTQSMMRQALKISQNNVVRYNLRDAYIYTVAGTAFPAEGISVEEWKRHVHPDDFEQTLQHLHDIMDHRMERAEFYYRWNNNFQGEEPQWVYMHNFSVGEYVKGQLRPVNIISTLADETQLYAQQQEERELTEKYKLIFEQSIVGLSFYSPDGKLIDANREMRRICHFDSDEGDAFFSEVNMFDMSPFRECCDPKNLEELWICTKSVVPEREIHDYLEIHLHPIRDDQGTLVYIAIAARNVSEERDMYLQVKLNDQQIRKANEEIQRYETELRYLMAYCEMQPWHISFERSCIEYYNGLSTIGYSCSLKEMKAQFVDQDDPYVQRLDNPEEYLSVPVSWTGKVHAVFTHRADDVWVAINSIPERDEKGRITGCFGLWRNITALMQKQEQLKRETERANDSGRQKSVFLANMTHEIRTPLNAIVGFSDLLQMIESPDEKREMIRIIHNNCDLLLRLINDILVLSNMDANAMQLTPERVDFSREFDDICQSLRQRVQEPGVEFQKDNPLESLVIDIDNRRIQQVITNFVTNAVKYTHQGHIRVGYRTEQRKGRDGLYVYCEDTGSGIPKEQQAAVFERFVKLNDFIQGTGLGLSICKAIIEKCGGEIGVDSEVEQGSTFWFWIPVTTVGEPTTAATEN